jgi:hypothetical protein
MRVRARIDPPNTIVPYHHLHLYNESGESLNAGLKVVERHSLEAHIKKGRELLDNESQVKLSTQKGDRTYLKERCG